ncbi:bola-like protein-domain-containing protein [Panaeolus papilionaceus]|nr:bola-like protein-domain-containing protein [Panaeolus papilionaceus]
MSFVRFVSPRQTIRSCSSLIKPKNMSLLSTSNQSSSNTNPTPGPVEKSIHNKLTILLLPLSIKVSNDSWQHRHHSAMREQGSTNGETHFSIQVVSNAFEKKTTMQRHRMIYAALSDEFAQGLHALSLKTQTQAEAERAQAS